MHRLASWRSSQRLPTTGKNDHFPAVHIQRSSVVSDLPTRRIFVRGGSLICPNSNVLEFKRFSSTTVQETTHEDIRKNSLEEFTQTMGIKPYSNKFKITKTLQEFREKYDSLAKGEKKPEITECLAGRIVSKREASSKLVFYDLRSGDNSKVQVMSSLKDFKQPDKFTFLHNNLKRGDVIGLRGYPGKTNLGELSIIPHEIQLLSPCIHNLPNEKYGLKDPETRYNQRYLDMLVNTHVKDTFVLRSKIISRLRTFLNGRGFLEVETPTLSPQVGGANAMPFVTTANAIGQNLYLRIAPELYLKQLVIGGIEKCYEIGKQFRNEGIDHTHNPEFTTCEFYQAYATYEDIMKTTEALLLDLVQFVTNGKNSITVTQENGSTVEIDFTPPFKRISLMSELEKQIGQSLPNLNEPGAANALLDICKRHHISIPPPHTTARLIDKLVGHFIEPLMIQPSFLVDYPIVLSPLAKQLEDNPSLTERFELYINGSEICNAYSELNDPQEQRRRFQLQQEYKSQGDKEAQPPDEHFCTALEYGLPPTAGWGLGIDRFVMLLTDKQSVREVIPFPIMKMHQKVAASTSPPPSPPTKGERT